MPAQLTRSSLKGVWPALLVPWTPTGSVDEPRLIREIQALAGSGVHGLYTGGTAGEFYAQDDETFRHLARVVCREAHALGIPVQIGCTALSARTARLRVRFAVDIGADGVQVALPFWLALSDGEVLGFFEEIAQEASPTPIVLYQTMRAKRRIDPPLLGKLAASFATFIGMKDTACDLPTLRAMRADAPDLAIFGTDIDLLERMQQGNQGTCSSVAGVNAQQVLKLYHLCAAGDFAGAEPIQNVIRRMMREVLIPMVRNEGLMDSAVDRVQRVVGGGDIGLECQPPYRSATLEHVERLRKWCRENALQWLPSRD